MSNVEDIYELSPMQQGMLFHALREPDSQDLYLLQVDNAFSGPLDTLALAQAWRLALERHPILRSSIHWAEVERPLQVVNRQVTLPVREEDWRWLAPTEQHARHAALVVEERRRFDLERAPLMRLAMVRMAEHEYRVVWTFHHIVLDGWSAVLVLRDVESLYCSLTGARGIPLAERRPYRDHILWLQQQDPSRAEAYWRRALEGISAPTPLTVDRAVRDPGAQPGQATELETTLSAEASQALRALARRHRLTLNTVVQGAWALLLARYSGQRDVVFGSVVSGRPPALAGSDAMVGLFINTLATRVRVEEDASVAGWLERLQRQLAEMREYEHSALVDVQGWSEVPRGQPLFESVVILQNWGTGAAKFLPFAPRVQVGDNRWFDGSTGYPLIAHVVPEDQVVLKAIFDRGRFERTTIERLLGHWRTLLEGIVARPEARVSELPLLRGAELALLSQWNRTGAAYDRDACLPDLVRAQAERTPDAVAAEYAGKRLTYRELERRADALARTLAGLGVAPGVRVGVYMERSLEMLVGLLGTLRAGGAYVPLDPSYPSERVSYMLEDSGPLVVLTQQSLLSTLGATTARALCVDGMELSDAHGAATLLAAVRAEDLAYVIYTSGSTGRPKGVGVTHRSVVNFLESMRAEPGLTGADVMLSVTTLSFDIAGLELYLPLLVGGRVVLASREETTDGGRLLQRLQESGATVMQATPATWRLLLEAGWSGGTGLKVLCGGEALTRELAEQLLERGSSVWNLYGPTETTIWSTLWRVEGGGGVTVGRPIGNTRVYVLDGEGRRVPVGVPGELCIGGEGLARGYWRRPDLTAERFVPDPHGEPGSRMYRTGDLARFLPDGRLEWHARLDQQVKVRGFRIELGEIESVLSRHAAVRQAVALVREDVSGDARLVAYVVCAADASGAESGQTRSELSGRLRSYLLEVLPEYMVPTAWVFLDAFPLTPNGKVDRKALPEPEAAAVRPALFVAPRSESERVIAGIWQEVLGVEPVGVHDDFFALGGHSLLAMRVVSRLGRAFDVELALRSLFESPSVAGLAEQVERARGVERLDAGPIVPVPRERPLGLSFAQQRLWFLEQLEPGAPLHTVPEGFRLKGKLDVAALERSLAEILRRHEVLRTTFAVVDGAPVQVVAAPGPYRLERLDLAELTESERAAERGRLLEEEGARCLDLTQGPLARFRLLKLGEDDHLLLVSAHHMVFDAWSFGILLEELSALYAAFCAGRPSPLAELPFQYVDFAEWQRRWLAGGVLEPQLAYWKRQLAELPVLDLPTDHPRPAAQTFSGAQCNFLLPRELSEGLHALSRREGVTLFMTLLAALQTLLSRHTGQEDVVVGSPIAGRSRPELESLIGLFVNMLVLRGDLSGDPSFRELLARVRRTTLEAYAAQDVPFERLVSELRPERDMSRAPLFQVMLVLQNAPLPAVELPNLALAPEPLARAAAQFDLTLYLRETAEGLGGTFEYNTDLFDAGTIQRMVGRLRILLEGVVANPEARVSGLPLLCAEELADLERWNRTGMEYERAASLPDLVTAQVRRTPDAVAAEYGSARLTYAALERRANGLARKLAGLGVAPGVLVGVYMERSLELLVGLLGILKAGGAYVPLDPSYPSERVTYMLEDSGPSIVVTQQALASALPRTAARVLCLDGSELSEGEGEATPLPAVRGEDLAYVIYTSGSTGRPKGVQITHRSLLNFLESMRREPGLSAEDVVLSVTTLSFDPSLLELYLPLLVGARVVLLSREEATDGARLHARLKESGATLMQATPSTWRLLLEAGWAGDARLKLLCGGESLPRELAERLMERSASLWNVYGPTETTVWSTLFKVVAGSGTVSIGRPIGNMRFYVLDRHARRVPVGVAGELCIGGEGVGWGYLKRADLTAEKFVPDPFGGDAGSRLYCSGDQARFLPDGRLEWLTRLDHQVKVRGHRIELGEIESVLARHAAVRRAVAVVREDVVGNARLVAYVVCAADASGAESGQSRPSLSGRLRSYLLEVLPEYMVPTAWVFLDAFPLTPSGKVDRKALPKPELAAQAAGYVAPRSESERVIAGIWQEVLGVERVGVHDDFFELGGHSLLAMRVLSRLARAFERELPLRSLFEAPSVAGLVEAVNRARGIARADAAPILRVSREGPLGLSFAQQRLWFLEQLEPGAPVHTIPACFRLSGRLEVAALERSLAEILRRHEVLRTTFAVVDGTPEQVVAAAGRCRLELRDLSGLAESERAAELGRLFEEEGARCLDLGQGPLARFRLLKLGAGDHLLLVSAHHMVFDGWSLGILLQELAALYAAFCAGQPSPLAELPFQYVDFAEWQRRWLAGGVLEPQLAYWKRQLAELPVLDLPTDRPRPAAQTFGGSHCDFMLPLELSERLNALSRREGVTLFMTLLAAFQTFLSRHAGQADVTVGSPIAGRSRPELESLIGLFVNMLVLRGDLSGDPSFRELLARVRRTTLEAFAAQDVPFERLVSELRPERDMSRTPLFQVMFVLQNAPFPEVELPGLTLGFEPMGRAAAQFDLTLYLRETAEGLGGTFEYNRDLFDAGTMERMVERLRVLLEGVVARPEARLSELPLLSAAEQEQLQAWNATARDYRRGALLPDLLEAQAERVPDAVAVELGGERLTYRDLNERANVLAAELRRLGVAPGALVGICLERSLEMLVALLGALKSGGAYVPLDPSYPAERVAYMLEDSGAKVLLTTASLAGSLSVSAARVLCLEAGYAAVGGTLTRRNPERAGSPEDLAYVIYTSGSTGRPKGVQVTHRSLVNFLESMRAEPGMTAEDVLLSVTTLSFDIAGLELYLPLVVGGRVVLASREEATDGERLRARLRASDATVMQATPATWRLLLEAGWPGDARLRVLCGGEALSPDLAQRLLERSASVWNLYGPTETTIWSTLERLERDGTPVTVGRPIGNTRVHVLDGGGRQVPVGVAGELHIGGEGLARGYWNRPDLTAERFVPDAYAEAQGARLYRTGDLARFLPDGRLEWLSRLDHQVKVRGFRIELGEIEAALARHPGVRRAVVVAKGGPADERRLVAYLLAAGAAEPTATELRKHLKAALPVFMVPAAFVFLDELPLTPNGKVDRKALDRLEARRQAAEDTYQPPRTPTESFLAELWREVLSVERIGLRDNFFDLGGHSLLAMKVIARVEKGIGHRLSPRDIVFQNLEQLAADCDQRRRKTPQPPVEDRAGREGDAVRVGFDGASGA